MAYTASPRPFAFGAFYENVDEFQRLRRLLPERCDFHLHNWGCWRRGYYSAKGYDKGSTGFVGGGYSQSFDDLVDRSDIEMAEVADTVLDDMRAAVQWANPVLAITIVYEASVFRFNRLSLEDELMKGAVEFWRRAVVKGLS